MCIRDRFHPWHSLEAVPRSQKQKNWLLCNFFSIRDSLPSPQSGIGLPNSRLSAFLRFNQRLGRHATIPNRKKVAEKSVFLFLQQADLPQWAALSQRVDLRNGQTRKTHALVTTLCKFFKVRGYAVYCYRLGFVCRFWRFECLAWPVLSNKNKMQLSTFLLNG